MHKIIFCTLSLCALLHIKIHASDACDVAEWTNKMSEKRYIKNVKDVKDWKRMKKCLKGVVDGIAVIGIIKDIAELTSKVPQYGGGDQAKMAEVAINYLKSPPSSPAANCFAAGNPNKNVREYGWLYLQAMACYHEKHGQMPTDL